jgi:hypothetical protein
MRPSAVRLLNILVPVKRYVSLFSLISRAKAIFRRAVDFAVKIRVNPKQTGIDTNVKHSIVRTEPRPHYIFTPFSDVSIPVESIRRNRCVSSDNTFIFI